MGKNTAHILMVLDRMETAIEVQRGRMGLLQCWLDEQGRRLELIASCLDQSMARIDALLTGPD